MEENAITLKDSTAALEKLAELGFDPEMGARPLRRVIQQKVEDPLSDKLLGVEFHDGDSILDTLNAEGEVVLEQAPEASQEEAPVV